MLAGALRWSSTAVTGGRLVAVGWGWGVGGGSCRVGSGYVGSRSGWVDPGRGVFSFFGVGVVGFGRIRGRTSDEQELCGR